MPVVLFTVGLALATGLVFGLVPALVASRSISDSLREGGRHGAGRRVLGALVITEVALALVLLTCAGLLIRSFIRLQNIHPGFRADHVLTARVQVPSARYNSSERSSGFFTEAVGRVSALPAVRSAAAVSFLPLSGPGIGTSFWDAALPQPLPGEAPTTDVRPVTPGFFRTMGIPELAGRDFTAADRGDAPRVAIISETLARRHLTGKPPLGQRLHVNIGNPSLGPYEVVGVVGDIKSASLDGEIRAAVYLPHTQLAIGMMTLVVRSDQDPLSLGRPVTAAVHGIDPELPVADVRSMEDVVSATLARPRIVAVLLTVFSLMALVLAAVGVYGVMAYSVAQRTQEFGVRMALGATPQSVFRLVIRQAMVLALAGVVAGLVAAGAAAQLLTSLMYDTHAFDPLTFAVTAFVLLVVAAVASYLPAWRSTRVAPVLALRVE